MLDDTTSPFYRTKEEFIREAIDSCPSVNPIPQVQEAVWGLVQYVTFNKGRLNFFNADTGLGKTTGFQQAIKNVWDKYWLDTPVLIMVPTRLDAEKMYLAMEALEEGCAGVWTTAHDPENTSTDDHFVPSRMFTKSEAASYKCLILTHNAGKDCESWVGRRDIVFVDEDPKPVSSDIFERYHFTKASDEESNNGPYGSIFTEAEVWALEQEQQGLSPVVTPKWVGKVLAVNPVTPSGLYIQKLAQGIKDGRAFQSRTRTTCWVSFDYDLPFQDRTIIFSATAHYEGFQFGSGNEFIRDHLPQIDYSNVEFKFKDWPQGLTKNHKQIVTNRQNREWFLEEMKNWITFATESTLIVCPKDLRSDIENLFPSAKVTNYGRDVGSNDYRECTEVYIVSEFHMPNDSLRANYLGHSGVSEVATGDLEPIQNTGSSLMKELKDANYSVHLKQMIARCNLRNIDEEGKAGKATVHCMINEGRFSRLLPKLFPKSALTYPYRETKPTASGDNTPIVVKAVRYLSSVSSEQDFVGSPELRDNGIETKGKRKGIQIAKGEPQFLSIGWMYRKGSAGRYGTPSGFYRL